MESYFSNIGNISIAGNLISISNHIFGRAIWDKFSKTTRGIYSKNCQNQACDYWLITPNQQTLCVETAGNYKSASRQLQNSIINDEMLITVNCVIDVCSISNTGNFSSGGSISNVDSFSNVGNMNNVGNVINIDSISNAHNIRNTGNFGSLGNINNTGNFSNLGV